MLAFFVALLASSTPLPAEPDCSGADHYPASMAFAAMKNDGLLSNEKVDFQHETSVMIASQHIKDDLWRQIFLTTFPLKAGGKITAIVVNDASSDECSIDTPKIYVISRRL